MVAEGARACLLVEEEHELARLRHTYRPLQAPLWETAELWDKVLWRPAWVGHARAQSGYSYVDRTPHFQRSWAEVLVEEAHVERRQIFLFLVSAQAAAEVARLEVY
jgi:hypothetical protein